MIKALFVTIQILARQALWVSALAISLLGSSCVVADSNPQSAHRLVVERIDRLLQAIQNSKSEKALSDEEKIELVDRQLGEVVDFKRIARRVMAKHFKNATNTQKQQFLAVFKSSLLNTYAKGLWEFNNYKVNILPLKEGKQTERNTQVSIEVVTSSGQVFPVTQSLFYNSKDKQWMVQNVIINGINMGLLFRDQFARLVAQNNGDIGMAIAAWTSEVATDTPAQVQLDNEAEEE